MIFYFSATGNSKHVAERVAQATGERLCDIGQALHDGQFAYDLQDDAYIGFVLPTFAWTIPGAVALFLEKLELRGVGAQYGFGILTAGGGTGGAPAALEYALRNRGIPYHASFSLVMIDNFIIWSALPPEQRIRQKLSEADRLLDGFLAQILAHEQVGLTGSVPEHPFMPLEPISSAAGTSKFTVSDACTGCGQCAEQCPMRCIQQSGGEKPVWEGSCTMCLGCLHRCPAAAIDYGRDTAGKKRYVYPGL